MDVAFIVMLLLTGATILPGNSLIFLESKCRFVTT